MTPTPRDLMLFENTSIYTQNAVLQTYTQTFLKNAWKDGVIVSVFSHICHTAPPLCDLSGCPMSGFSATFNSCCYCLKCSLHFQHWFVDNGIGLTQVCFSYPDSLCTSDHICKITHYWSKWLWLSVRLGPQVVSYSTGEMGGLVLSGELWVSRLHVSVT